MGMAEPPPDSIWAQALDQHTISVSWSRVAAASGYILQRRTNLTGAFTPLTQIASQFTTMYSDDSLAPETIYGYRVVSISLNGVQSSPSLIIGARTAPVPGIVATAATAPVELGPAAGYKVHLSGSGVSEDAIIGGIDSHRFGPLKSGIYQVTLSGVPTNCTVTGGAQQTDTVTEQGLETLKYSTFNISCKDPHVGALTIHVTTTGDSLDADGYGVKVSGVLDDSTAYFHQEVGVKVPAGTVGPLALKPGTYTIELSGVAGNCAVTGGPGAATVRVRVNALDDLSQSFAVVCTQPEDPTKPLVWKTVWSSATAPKDAHVSMTASIDLTRKPGQDITTVQGALTYDATVLRVDSVNGLPRYDTGSLWQTTANSGTPGTVFWQAFVNGTGPVDSAAFARFYFTVIGAAGASTAPHMSFDILSDANGDNLIPLVRRSEAAFTVASGSGGGSDQPPTARPGGPYSGTAGVAVSFNGSASSDPDGSITGWSWSFGDGTNGNGAMPTHIYAAAGTYTVGLTVTDNGGLTASATTSATITSGGGGGTNQAPIAVVNGPYTGVAGTPISFSAAGSSDPDGSIAGYAWDFGDGSSGSGSAPTHAYSASGTFTVRLTVTDNQGATGAAQTSATITSGGSSKPFTWRNDFGPVGVDSIVALNITLDFSTDIAQTNGPEALYTWRLDSLKWDPNVMTFYSFNFGGGAGSVNPTDAATGKLVCSGVQSDNNSTGLITIARIQFKVKGASGSATTTATALGTLLGTAATGSFSYGAYTAVVEGTVQAP